MENETIAPKNIAILRKLAEKYTELALADENLSIPDRYRDLNSLKHTVRPPVLVFEEPWGELECEELRLKCENSRCRRLEWRLRVDIFRCLHHRGDYALKPYAEATVAVDDSGYGFVVKDSSTIRSVTGSSISSHRYTDLLEDESALKQFRLPDVSLNEYETQSNVELVSKVFEGLLPVRKAGIMLYMPSWDEIAMLRGVENCMIDLYDRPEYTHAIVEQFTRIQEHRLTRYEELNVLETDPYYLHCTPACTRELPVKDMDRDKITAKDVWCRSMAQAFSMVSPKIRDEFDLKYIQRLFDRCGLSYYGCCEPLHDQIPNLRKRFKNLRRISITPWADPNVAADNIGGDYVLSYKPNPAFVSRGVLDEEAARKEIRRVILACNRNKTPFEFVLKDISTVNGRSEVLSEWVDMAESEIDRYWKP
ncbi:MAG: hypothetical protein K5663_07100 [Clostridiales bacterium]|nr:hypothetical protein [Clostridiales bacterium]